MAKPSWPQGIHDALEELIRDTRAFADESVPGFWRVESLIRSTSAQLRTLRCNPTVQDDHDQYIDRHTFWRGRRFGGSFPDEYQLRTERCSRSSPSSPDEFHRRDEHRDRSPLSLTAATLATDLGHEDDILSPMSLEFGPAWTARANEEFLTSHAFTNTCDLGSENDAADMSIDPQALSRRPRREQGTTDSLPDFDRAQIATVLVTRGIDIESAETQNMSEVDMNEGEADQLLELFLTPEAVESQIEESPKDCYHDSDEEDVAPNTNKANAPCVERTAHSDNEMSLCSIYSRKFDSESLIIGQIQNGRNSGTSSTDLTDTVAGTETEARGEVLPNHETRRQIDVKNGTGRRNNPARDENDVSIPIEVARMPYYRNCLVQPETAYSLILSKCSQNVSVTSLSALTKLFFGLASPDSLRELQEVCLSERSDHCSFSRDLDLRQTFKVLQQLETGEWALKISRRIQRARAIDHRDMRVQKLREELGKRSRREKQNSDESGDIRTRVLEEMMVELYPGLGKENVQYRKKYTSLMNQLRFGRHWHALKNRTSGGAALLALLPRNGPHKVLDSE